jgi:Trypsin-like peptidase domain
MLARILKFFVLVAGISGAASPAAVAAEECTSRELVTSFGTWYSPNLTLDAQIWSSRLTPAPTNFEPTSYRFSISVRPTVIDRNWNVVFRDDAMRVLATMGPEDFTDADGKMVVPRWTGRLASPSVIVDLLAHGTSDVAIDIAQGIAYPHESSDARLFSIQGPTPSWHPLYSGTGDQIPKRAGDAVGMLVSAADDPGGKTESWCCSGVMVARDLMLTNWHCGGHNIPDSAYWNKSVVANTLIDLSWDGGAVARQYSGAELVMKDEDLDFALIKVRPVAGGGGEVGGAVRATIATHPLKDFDPIFQIHHAQCKPKLLSSHCKVVSLQFPGWIANAADPGAPKTDFTHDCDTETGSSGSPIFDDQGLLVGLHHLGFQKNAKCEADRLNKAVQISEIVERILEVHPELLKDLWFK